MLKIKNTKHLDTAEEIFTEFLDKFQKYAADAAEISKGKGNLSPADKLKALECLETRYEAWAELKECIERTKQMHTDIEKVHKEMWSAVKDRNEDAFAALSQEFERSSRILAEEWAQTSALAKIAVISESND